MMLDGMVILFPYPSIIQMGTGEKKKKKEGKYGVNI
jgi:hypothetical protein